MTRIRAALLTIILAVVALSIINGPAIAQQVINGYRILTNVAAPATPASGTVAMYTDSTSKRFSAKDDAGNITTTMPPAQITAIPSSDQISAAGAFATTISVPSTYIAVGSLIEVRAHGIYTTTATSSPKFNMRVNAGGTTGICPSTGPTTLTTNQTNSPWSVVCFIQINTTGNPGTAVAWGTIQSAGSSGTPTFLEYVNTGTVSYITTSAQTVSVEEVTAMVTGQTFTLQAITVKPIW